VVILEKTASGVSRRALALFVARARRAAGLRGTVDVLITSNAHMRELNQRFRRKHAATDVLSFPASSQNNPSRRAGRDSHAGDLAISCDIAAQNARALGHSVERELKILILHGVLHLAGYDHENDNGEMARKEARLRRMLGLPMSLIERTNGTAPRKRARKSRR
jgi:probable rRNA maturation factor